MISPENGILSVALVFGLVIGSFLNVLIYRLPRSIPVSRGRSCCPHCGDLIRWWHNVPLVSYVWLRGRCASCAGPISLRYPTVELVTALAFVGWVHRLGLTVQALGYIYLSCVLICVLFIDWEFQLIPDKLTYPSIAAGLIWALVAPLGIREALLGAVVGGVGLLLVALIGDWVFKKESMGGGDIKLAAALGAFLGWKMVLIVFFLSALIGVIVSIGWLAVSAQMREKRLMPFGPFLAVAAVVAAIWGPELLRWYLTRFWVA
jgi:leader peptidase (prepilin peptidase)/N-methyltransferase